MVSTKAGVRGTAHRRVRSTRDRAGSKAAEKSSGGDVDDAVRALDEFSYGRSFMLNVGAREGRAARCGDPAGPAEPSSRSAEALALRLRASLVVIAVYDAAAYLWLTSPSPAPHPWDVSEAGLYTTPAGCRRA